MELASFKRRLIALIIDIFIQLTISILILSVLLVINESIKISQIIIDLVFYVSFFAYSIVKDFIFKNASIGKKILKLRVVDKHTFESVCFKRIFLRDLFTAEWATTFLMYSLKKKTFGEMISSTVVVKIGKPGYGSKPLEK